MISSKHFSRNVIKAIVLFAIVVATLGITSWNSELKSSKKHHPEKDAPAIKELTIPVDGAELYVKVIGKGRPILFIHGGPGLVHNYFLPYTERLLPYGYQLIFYDQRGNGKSPSFSPDSIKLDLFVQDIESIRKKLGVEKLVLFGHSFGGYLAYLYALKYPEHVDAIIGCDVGPLTEKQNEEVSAGWKKQLEQVDLKAIKELPGISEAAKGMPDDFLKIMANRFYNKNVLADFLVSTHTEFMNPAKAEEVQNRLYREMEKTLLYKNVYEKPKAYALFIHGAEDPIPVSSSEYWVKLFDGRLQIINGSNHFPFVEKPDEVARVVNEFLTAKKSNYKVE